MKQKEAYQYWMRLHRNFPRTERFGLGNRIDAAFLDVLEYTFSCIYLPPAEKISVLERAISRLDKVKFFAQIAWESKLVPTKHYAAFAGQLEEIGRQLGGWRKGLLIKTSATKTEERKE
jgi:hypothetical protein